VASYELKSETHCTDHRQSLFHMIGMHSVQPACVPRTVEPFRSRTVRQQLVGCACTESTHSAQWSTAAYLEGARLKYLPSGLNTARQTLTQDALAGRTPAERPLSSGDPHCCSGFPLSRCILELLGVAPGKLHGQPRVDLVMHLPTHTELTNSCAPLDAALTRLRL
jgi:hypothetical protein